MSKNLKITLSFIVFFIGILLFASEYFNSKKIEAYDYINELYYNQTVDVDTDEVTESTETNEENNEESKVEDTGYNFTNNTESIYIGYLSIPDISLKKGFTSIDSKYNNVNKNIQILSASDYPDKEKGNVILAAHSGNSSVSYFNQLYKLNKGVNVYIDYNNIKYTYKIVNIYTIEKTGQASIVRDKDKNTLTLITCTKNSNTTQTIYICELISKE